MGKWINSGDDERIDPFGLVSWLQRKLSFASDRPPEWEPDIYTFNYWYGPGPYVVSGFYWRPYQGAPLAPYYIRQWVHNDGQVGDWTGHDERRGVVSFLRYGHRYDPNAKPPSYIFGMAFKWKSEDRPMGKGY